MNAECRRCLALSSINLNAGQRKYSDDKSLMVKKKPSCGRDEQHNLHSGSLIEDLPDSPLSCTEERLPCWEKTDDAVLWSNAAFRSYDMVNDTSSASSSTRTSLTSSTCSNEDNKKDISPSNSLYRDEINCKIQMNSPSAAQLTSRSENSTSLNNPSVEKPKFCTCQVLGTPIVIAVNISVGGVTVTQGYHTIYQMDGNPTQNQKLENPHSQCQTPMVRRHEPQQDSPAVKPNSSPKKIILLKPQSQEKVKNGKDSKSIIALNDGMSISEEEAKIKAELENEIEKELEEEIKDGICDLSRRLAELHARRKARSGDNHKTKSDEKMISLAGNNNNQKNAIGVMMGSGSNISILCPHRNPEMPTSPISPFRQIGSPVVSNGGKGFRRPGKNSGGNKISEKKVKKIDLEKDFDWVRTLRSGSKATPSPPELNKNKQPNYTLAAPERLRNDPTMITRRCSRALFMDYSSDSNNEVRSKGESRRCKRHGFHHNSHCSKDGTVISLGLRGNVKPNLQISPKHEDSRRRTGSTQRGPLRKKDSEKGNAGQGEGNPVGQTGKSRVSSTEENFEEDRTLLVDLMNRLKISDTKSLGEKPKKLHFSETKLLHRKQV